MSPASLPLVLASTAFLVAMVTKVTSQSTCATYETYNVALIGAVGGEEERRPRIIEALKSSSSDVLCLQEVWFENDVAAIVTGLKDTFPHHFTAIHASKDVLDDSEGYSFFERRACNVKESVILSGGLAVCGLWNGCLGKSGYALGVCAATNCGYILKLDSVSESCVSCIFMNAFTSFLDAIKKCSIPKDEPNRYNGPGLLLLSKSDLGQVSYTSYFPNNRQTFQRGYILADLPNGMTAVCTHLSSMVDAYIEYDLPYGDYKTQQAVEISQLDQPFQGQATVLLGDLNTGPRVTGDSDPDKNLEGEFVENFDALGNIGFQSVYVSEDGRCTFCKTNALTGGYANQILDHVLIKGSISSATKPARLYDTADPPLSDHYAVSLEVCI